MATVTTPHPRHTRTFNEAQLDVEEPGSETLSKRSRLPQDSEDVRTQALQILQNKQFGKEMLDAFVQSGGLLNHQFESFNRFVPDWLIHMIKENSTTEVVGEKNSHIKHKIEFKDVLIKKPIHFENDGNFTAITPRECRLRKLTYQCSVYVDVVHSIYNLNEKDEKGNPYMFSKKTLLEVPLCQIPVLVRSDSCRLRDTSSSAGECPLDDGGYFIINGNEKIVLGSEVLRTNYVYGFKVKQPSKYSHNIEIRSCHETKLRSTSTLTMFITHARNGSVPQIHVNVPFLMVSIPLVAIFHVLGVRRTEDMVKLILHDTGDAELNNKLSDMVWSIVGNDNAISAKEKDKTGENSKEKSSNGQNQRQQVKSFGEMSLDDVCDWVGKEGTKEIDRKKRIRSVKHIFQNEFLPHIGLNNEDPVTLLKKTVFLGRMVFKLCMVQMGKWETDDRDHYAFKRVDTTGVLMARLFRPLFRTTLRNMARSIKKCIDSEKLVELKDMLRDRVTNGFRYALSTGRWGVQKGGSSMTGVAQIHSRMTMTSGLGNRRRVNTHINKEGKMPKPRQLHLSHWGIMCAVETPEGEQVGLVKNMALFCHIRPGYDPDMLMILLRGLPRELIDDKWQQWQEYQQQIQQADSSKIKYMETLVLVNGVLVGVSQEPVKLCQTIRTWRRKQKIPFDTTCVHDHIERAVHITTDSGCCCRPVFVVENLYKLPNLMQVLKYLPTSKRWSTLVHEGIIEYIDKHEEMMYRIAVFPADLQKQLAPGQQPYTHLEVNPICIFGIAAGFIPFPEHNQAPRNLYQTAMGKQAHGIFALNMNNRVDTVSYDLCYPQVPLTQTGLERALHVDMAPYGENFNIAIASYTGYNQEDSMILNQGSVDRGLGRSLYHRTYREEEKTRGTDSSRFEKPDPENTIGMREAKYDKLQDNGLPAIGTVLGPGDAIISKTISSNEIYSGHGGNMLNKNIKRDASTLLKGDEPCQVTKIVETKNREGVKAFQVQTTSMRIPEIGDKFSSRHGQKGTVGMILPECDMPYRIGKKGSVIDAIINPHCMPSRMTIGMLLEMLLGKYSVQKGQTGDGTPFIKDMTLEQIGEWLHRECGIQRFGHEKLINGMTGEPIEALVFVAPCYYQRLKHMVVDKIHEREDQVVFLTLFYMLTITSVVRNKGLGEMERDALIGHGCTEILKDRLFHHSDPYIAFVCKQCGLLAQSAREEPRKGFVVRASKPYCRGCRSSDTVVQVKMPYAAKLLIQELMGMCLAVRLRLSPDVEEVSMEDIEIVDQTQTSTHDF